jgi:hypothetical protein
MTPSGECSRSRSDSIMLMLSFACNKNVLRGCTEGGKGCIRGKGGGGWWLGKELGS